MSVNTVEYANQLLAENERLKQQLQQLAAERENFAVECAAAKIAIAYWSAGKTDFTLNTPTTDAWLNEIRAQSLLAASDELKALAKRSEDGAAEHIHTAALFVQVIAAQLCAGEVSNG